MGEIEKDMNASIGESSQARQPVADASATSKALNALPP